MMTSNELKVAPAIPEILAVIDIGSNSIRMVVAQLLPDGRYGVVLRTGDPIRAQEKFYEDAVEAVRSAERTACRFRPLTHAKPNGTMHPEGAADAGVLAEIPDFGRHP